MSGGNKLRKASGAAYSSILASSLPIFLAHSTRDEAWEAFSHVRSCEGQAFLVSERDHQWKCQVETSFVTPPLFPGTTAVVLHGSLR